MMPAIKYTKTPTSDAAWDGPANEARLTLGADESYYRQFSAWQDPDADPTTKTAFRFGHHLVSEGGDIGAANVAACRSGCETLNGARGGTTIPEADRAGVHAHLAAHLTDAGIDAPALRSISRAQSGVIERRAFGVHELRVSAANEPPQITGHAAVFNSLSDPLDDFFGQFQERIAAGAFTKTLREGDQWALWAHDPSQVLGRKGAGTLTLTEDARGLAFTIHPPDTQVGRDAMLNIRNGNVNGCSFGFRVVKDHWTPGEDKNGDPMDIRTLNEVRLYEISPTPMPAYPATDVSARALLIDAGVNLPAVSRAVLRWRRGLALSASDRDMVAGTIDILSRALVPVADGDRDHQSESESLPAGSPVTAPRHSDAATEPTDVVRHSREELRRSLDRLSRIYDR